MRSCPRVASLIIPERDPELHQRKLRRGARNKQQGEQQVEPHSEFRDIFQESSGPSFEIASRTARNTTPTYMDIITERFKVA